MLQKSAQLRCHIDHNEPNCELTILTEMITKMKALKALIWEPNIRQQTFLKEGNFCYLDFCVFGCGKGNDWESVLDEALFELFW